MFHPVTTEILTMDEYAISLSALLTVYNYIVVFPNNDLGSKTILQAYERLKGNPRFRVFPSLPLNIF
jgi:UDP-N-acetylglucosamine 2-epimerase (hydrolysing)